MQTKSTKVTKKTDLKNLDAAEKKSQSKIVGKKVSSSSTKKVVVKRRKTDLIPSKASAVAIVSQANRAKKQALIEKIASEENIDTKISGKSSTKIPLWVWIFFGCSLLLFCVSFYQAIIRPQIEEQVISVGSGVENNLNEGSENIGGYDSESVDLGDISGSVPEVTELNDPRTAEETIKEFFDRLSSKQFDEAFSMFTPALQKSSEILEHFTSFRMDPFVSGIEGGSLSVSNIQFIDKSSNGRDRYKFNLSYVLGSSSEKYDEEREFLLDTGGDAYKIASVLCITSKCSYHPIFWPENFGLMK